MMYMLSNRDRIVSSNYDQSLLWVTLLLLGLGEEVDDPVGLSECLRPGAVNQDD